MDPQEANSIARHLTQLWTNLLRSRVINNQDAQAKAFLNQLKANGQIVFKYEEQELQDKALDLIPLQRLYEEAEEQIVERGGSLEDRVIQRLLHWFKNEFFTWVDNAPCDFCQSTSTRSAGYAKPNSDDLFHGAHVVETYLCSQCVQITRFPRYNSPSKLLETRRGRCGEWANCFTLCCRAVGSEARIVYDTTDHVWTEVFSESDQRWVHCDSCEEAWDRPLLYSIGWNKQLNYCTAFSVDEAVDVTKRYTKGWPEVLKRRNKVKEAQLNMFLNDLSEERQRNLDLEKVEVLNDRRLKELIELEESSKKAFIKDEELVGRQSGSLVWRTNRGETTEISTTGTENTMKKVDLANIKLYHTVKQASEAEFILSGAATMLYDGRSFLPNQPMLRITEAIPDQRGGANLKQPVELNEDLLGLEVEFAFRITDKDGLPPVNGADGFAFVIQSQGENALGEGGCELGYGGISNCLAVEFDTYQSSDRCADPSGNHISVHARRPPSRNSAHHNFSLGHTSRIPPLHCGKWLKAKIRLLTKGTIEVGLGEIDDNEYIPILKVENQCFKTYMGSSSKNPVAWIGFTASTGGLSQNHDVQLISFVQFKAS